ncbi:MAG: hypothetical protein Q8Q56_04760 [Alphaproteobacteria bacterium]|nr:hypothetical protein [Alphaproteobacteria bacterium]
MINFYTFIVFAIFGVWGVDAAADDVAAETAFTRARFNCVIEKNGTLHCHEGHDEQPCIIFFDVIGKATQPINPLILAKLQELKLMNTSVKVLWLELFGVSKGKSIHHEGWSKMTQEQLEAFWSALSAADVEAAVRDLNDLPLGAIRFADYVIKVSYHT